MAFQATLSQTLLFFSLCSFLPTPLGEGLGYECKAIAPSCVGYTGWAVMVHPSAGARGGTSTGYQGPHLGEGRKFSVILSHVLLKDCL